jgi:hypothetical protein
MEKAILKAKIDYLSLMCEVIPQSNPLFWKYQTELELAAEELRALMATRINQKEPAKKR